MTVNICEESLAREHVTNQIDASGYHSIDAHVVSDNVQVGCSI